MEAFKGVLQPFQGVLEAFEGVFKGVLEAFEHGPSIILRMDRKHNYFTEFNENIPCYGKVLFRRGLPAVCTS